MMRRALRIAFRALREIVWVVIAAAVIYGAFQGFQLLGDNRPIALAAPVERPVALVETAELSLNASPLPVRGEGFIRPYRSVALSAIAGGRVMELHPALIDRQGQFAAGDVLVRLDDRAERTSLDQITANITATQARLDLNQTQLERTQSLRDSGSASQGALDQLLSQNAELAATLEGFEAALVLGQIALDTKTVYAPFDGAVLTKLAEVGSVVGAGQSIAEIYTSGQLDVDIAVREADAALIPGLFQDAAAPAEVTISFAGRDISWDARVARFAPALDPQTRTLTVTVEIIDVNGGRADDRAALASGASPALINAFAQVVVTGENPAQTYQIPSTALRNGNAVWVLDAGELAILPASLVHVDRDTSFVRIDAVPDGARLILTALSSPVAGMALREVSTAAPAAIIE
ncbi:MAG: efflux RND transporter periplasmic adaptor subunit [Cypionkella sp.]